MEVMMLQTTIKDTNRTAFDTLYSIRNVLAPEAMTALYCRLSVDDANEGDSNSIQNQKKFSLTTQRKTAILIPSFSWTMVTLVQVLNAQVSKK